MVKQEDIYDYKPDDKKSYYRRKTGMDFVVVFVACILMMTGFGLIIAIPLVFLYQDMFSKVCISDLNDRNQKMWVTQDDWKNYRQNHNISIWSEYLKKERLRVIDPNVNVNNSADELLKYKKLLDADIITQNEFDTKKQQILND